MQLGTRCPVKGVVVLEIAGDVDVSTAPLLWSVVRKQIAARPRVVVLDLCQVQFLGASGVEVLLTAQGIAPRLGGSCSVWPAPHARSLARSMRCVLPPASTFGAPWPARSPTRDLPGAGRHMQVQAVADIGQVETADLADALQAVPERAAVDHQRGGGVVIVAAAFQVA